MRQIRDLTPAQLDVIEQRGPSVTTTQPVTWRLYHAAGSPPVTLYGDDTPMRIGMCRLCGVEAEGYPWARWVKDTFTDHDLLGPGDAICVACLCCADDHSAVLQARTGREKLQRMRNYSHIVTRRGHWLPLGKDQKAVIASALLDGPDVAVISLSGQKHVVFRARVGQWQIEEQRCWPDPARLQLLLTAVQALYREPAVTKAMIETGEYSPRALAAIGPREVYTLDAALRPHRGSPLFSLAVWLAQREDTDDDSTARCSGRAADANLARHPDRLQDEIQLHDLGSVSQSGAQRRLHEHAAEVSQPDLFSAASEPRGSGTE